MTISNLNETETVGTESQPTWVKPQLILVNEEDADGKNFVGGEATSGPIAIGPS